MSKPSHLPAYKTGTGILGCVGVLIGALLYLDLLPNDIGQDRLLVVTIYTFPSLLYILNACLTQKEEQIFLYAPVIACICNLLLIVAICEESRGVYSMWAMYLLLTLPVALVNGVNFWKNYVIHELQEAEM